MFPAQLAPVGFAGSLAHSGQLSDCWLIQGVAEKPPMTQTTRSAWSPKACFQVLQICWDRMPNQLWRVTF
jgi:hypothetical protein